MSASPPHAVGWPDHPVLLEINTWVWLDELSRRRGGLVDLGTVTDRDWDDVLLPGVDAVWLMGVWQRSALGAEIARTDAGVRAELETALPGMTDDDVVGSPYCVRAYTVDERLGGDEGLSAARDRLARRGIRVLVDYVPNHVAHDHEWAGRVDHVVGGDDADLQARPGEFTTVGGRVVALARDPYFPPWTDVAQLDAFSPALRAASADALHGIAERADGVRCDMAMLMLNEVFARTWGERAGPVPSEEFWPGVISAVRRAHPGFLFVAEAYWGTESVLLGQGFDYCYDKTLYDRLTALQAEGVRAHLTADLDFQRRTVRFIENHDEPRSACSVPEEARRALAVAITTLPGALLLYEGQADGRRERPPVQLGRRPDEVPDVRLRAFYEALLTRIRQTRLREGAWRLEPATGGVVAWSWQRGDDVVRVAVNLSDQPGTAGGDGGAIELGPWDFAIAAGDRS